MTESISADRSYRPGGWYAVFGAKASVLLPESEKARVAPLWERADAGADFDELLDALIADGLRSLPGFVLLSAADPTRIVLRGAARATVRLPGGESVEVDGAAAATWVERSFAEVDSIELLLEEVAENAELADFPIIGGLVRVSRVDRPARSSVEPLPATGAVVDRAEEQETVAADLPEPAGDDPEATVADLPAVEEAPGEEERPAAGQHLAAVPDWAVTEEDTADDAVSRPSWDDQPSGVESVEASTPPEEAPPAPAESMWGQPDQAPAESAVEAPASPFEAATDEQPRNPFAPTAEDASDAGADAGAPADEAPATGAPEMPMWGAPPSAPESPSAPEMPTWGAPSPTPESPAPEFPAPETPTWGAPPEPPAAEEGAAQTPAWGAPSPVPEAPSWGEPTPGPGASESGTPAWGAPADVEDPDHDGDTASGPVDHDQFARQHPGIPGQPQAPSITAQPVARLVFSHGEDVEVDRAVLIGRAPEARRFTSTDQPRLVTVPSPNSEISSTHLEVRPGSGADHGSAIVTDMGSTNGTVLTQPGLAPEDLQPGIAVQLLPGAVIDLGDGVTIQVTSA